MIKNTFRLLFVTVICVFSFSHLSAHSQDIRIESNNETIQQYETVLLKAVKRLKQARRSRIYRLRAINDSIKQTEQAVQILIASQNYRQAADWLKKALKSNEDNVVAELLLADTMEKSGDIEAANNAYLRFLKKAARASKLTRQVLDSRSRYWIARYVRGKLKERGIQAPEPKGLKHLPLMSRLSFGHDSWMMTLVADGLPLIAIFGGLLILIRHMVTAGEPVRSVSGRFAVRLFFVCLCGLALWLAHLFLNLPPLVEPVEYEITLFLTAGTILAAALTIKQRSHAQKARFADPTLMPCPFCKEPVQKIAAVCPSCGKKL